MRSGHLALMLCAVVLLSGNYVMAVLGLKTLPPFLYTALRFMVVVALVMPFTRRMLPAADMRRVLLLSFILCTLHFGLNFCGLALGLDIATSVILAQLGVPLACMMGVLFLKEPFGRKQAAGLAISFAGVVLVEGAPQVSVVPLAFVVAFAGAVAAAVSNIYLKRLTHIPVFDSIGWMSLLAIPQLLIISWLFEREQWPVLATIPAGAVAAVFYSAIASTIVAHATWFFMLKHYSVNQVAPFSLLIPFGSIMIGHLFFPSDLTWQVVCGGVLTIAGVAIITLKLPKFARTGGLG